MFFRKELLLSDIEAQDVGVTKAERVWRTRGFGKQAVLFLLKHEKMNINSSVTEDTNIKEFGSPLTVLHVSNSFIKTSRFATVPVKSRKLITTPSYKYEDMMDIDMNFKLKISHRSIQVVTSRSVSPATLIKMCISAKAYSVLDFHLLRHITI